LRDKKRIKRILVLIEKVWNKYPDDRLGQLLENEVFGYNAITDKQVFHIEDDKLEEYLKTIIKKSQQEE